jgi:SAM-dependent methyltransferase
MGAAFDATQFDICYPPGIGSHYWHLARNAIIAGELRRLVGPGSVLLDVGCGRGAVLASLRERGFDCHGVEPAKVTIDPAIAPFVTTGREAGELDEDQRRRFDTLLLFDVLEHLADPEAFLARLASDFPRAERLLVTVPARTELRTGFDDFYGHLRRYDRPLLRAQAAAAGWRPLRCRYFFRLLYVPIYVVRQLGRQRSVAISPPLSAPRRLAHRAIAALCVAEQALLPGWVGGASILGAFERQRAATR